LTVRSGETERQGLLTPSGHRQRTTDKGPDFVGPDFVRVEWFVGVVMKRSSVLIDIVNFFVDRLKGMRGICLYKGEHLAEPFALWDLVRKSAPDIFLKEWTHPLCALQLRALTSEHPDYTGNGGRSQQPPLVLGRVG